MPLRDQIDPKTRAMSLGWHRPPDDPAKRACRWCGGPVPKGRRSWCSGACVHEARMRSDPGYARSKVLERDHGICCQCGVDCARLERLAERLRKLAWAELHYSTITSKVVLNPWIQTDPVDLRPHPTAERRGRDLEILLAILALWAGHDLRDWNHWPYSAPARLKHSLWQADHITPVVEGGGGCGLDNYRTLCLRCHKGATAGLAHRRRRQKELPL